MLTNSKMQLDKMPPEQQEAMKPMIEQHKKRLEEDVCRIDMVDYKFLEGREDKDALFKGRKVKNEEGRKAFEILGVKNNIGLVQIDYLENLEELGNKIYHDGEFGYKLRVNPVWR